VNQVGDGPAEEEQEGTVNDRLIEACKQGRVNKIKQVRDV
jgi:hypothetical protein